MPGSFTVTPTSIGNGLTKYSIAWTASAGGAVSGTSFPMKTGRVLQVKFVQGTASSGYSATLLDADGVDLFAAGGSDLTATTLTKPDVTSNGSPINDATIGSPAGSVTPTIASAGNATSGRIDVIVGP